MQIRSQRLDSISGFSMVEALVAIFVTLIVMSTLFGFLAGGASTSTVEMDRADLQAQTRHALDQISRDVMLAGYGLPPEFPSFGNGTGIGISAETQQFEIRGMAGDAFEAEPIEVVSFDGRTARVAELPPSLALGQPVLVYDDLPVDGSWILGLVSGIRTNPAYEVELVTEPGASLDTSNGTVSLPANMNPYNRLLHGPPESGFMTPVSIVSYELENAAEDAMPTLVRQVNWGERTHVAHIESMEIRYFVGGTLPAPVIEPPQHRRGRRMRIQTVEDPPRQSDRSNRPARPRRASPELGLIEPPPPQPNPRFVLDENDVIRAVRISLTGRSRHANLVGSQVESNQSTDEEGFVRQTLSTRVATRNLVSRAELRRLQLDSQGETP